MSAAKKAAIYIIAIAIVLMVLGFFANRYDSFKENVVRSYTDMMVSE